MFLRKNRLKQIMITIISILLILSGIIILYVRQDKFGKAPAGERLERMNRSPHFKNGKFENLHETPVFDKESGQRRALFNNFFRKHPGRRPADTIPSVKTDLLNFPHDQNVLVWFGHSSYFIQVDGKRILVDPVFSGNASPVPGMIKAFRGADIYSVEDLPEIDYLLITHDHYDHLDHETVCELRSKTGLVICGLGVGTHLEYWGYDKAKIIEKDWYEDLETDSGFIIHTTPARHFSGRSLARNNTLWLSFVLQTPTMKIFIGGDSGYDTHFAEAGEKYGPFDLAVIENGQYNDAWRYIHAKPEEVLKAARDLNARRLLPVHSGKFALGMHPWKEPLVRIAELSKSSDILLLTPMIGEPVNLKDNQQIFKRWWEEIK